MNPVAMFEQVLGDDYSRLPPAVQRFHRLDGHRLLHGRVETQAPSSLVVKALALCLRLPRQACSGPFRFELSAGPAKQTWTRHFPSHTMTSSLRIAGAQLEETLGCARLTFRLQASEQWLRWRVEKLRFAGIPCPGWLMPVIVAEETGMGDEMHFHITAALPVLGRVASYRGYVDLGRENRR